MDRFISRCFIKYIEWVACTSTIILEGEWNLNLLENCIIGFCHGDSLGMNFLLREMNKSNNKIYAIVTEDKRGDYIEEILKEYGATALRMPDGSALRKFLNELKNRSKESYTTMCIALDGPLGPLKEPKKLGFMLSYEGEKQYVLIRAFYSKRILLKERWDKYAIPLPFGNITFRAYNQGVITSDQLKNFKSYKSEIKALLE